MKKWLVILGLAAAAFGLAACSAGEGDDQAAARAVEQYLAALAAGDLNALANLVCAAWEEDARIETEAFLSVATRLEGVTCAVTDQTEGQAVVTCQGNIVATYNGEDQTFAVDRPYVVVQEGGEWRVCGYQP